MTAALGEHVFGTDERELPEIVLDLLRERAWTAAAAESCTGGMVAARLTDIPGSSDVFAGGVVTYSNELKHALLGVPAEVLARHGAVSPEAAEAMAAGARERLGADVAVAVTGIAGPGGGTPEKPVGLVYLHVSSPAGEDPVDVVADDLGRRGGKRRPQLRHRGFRVQLGMEIGIVEEVVLPQVRHEPLEILE